MGENEVKNEQSGAKWARFEPKLTRESSKNTEKLEMIYFIEWEVNFYQSVAKKIFNSSIIKVIKLDHWPH